jgi:hypothetical protein
LILTPRKVSDIRLKANVFSTRYGTAEELAEKLILASDREPSGAKA